MEWISVKDPKVDRPNDREIVLFCTKDKTYAGCLINGRWIESGSIYGERVRYVTHWMPLPEPPEEKQ